MKKIIFLLVLVSSMCLSGFSQAIPDPEFSERPYILTTENTFKNFERADAIITQLAKRGFGAGLETFYDVSSPKSEMQFSRTALPRIIIKVSSNIDITEQAFLYKSKEKKKSRKFVISSDNSKIKLTITKVRDGIFEIILPSNIESGEYAFSPIINASASSSVGSKIIITCFGIN